MEQQGRGTNGAEESLRRRLDEVDPDRRRQLVVRSILRSVATVIVLAVVYFAVPFTDRFEGSVVLIASVGLILVIATVVWQVRSVVTAPMPVLRAIEGFALVLPLVLFAFAAAYLAVSAGTTNAFTESLNHTGAMYFSVTTMTTVGYGDIAPMSDLARVFVMAQMIINVAVLGVAVRVTATAVRRNLGRS